MKSNTLNLLGEPTRVARAIAWVARDLIARQVSVGEVYDMRRRQKYASGIPKEIVVAPAGPGVPAATTHATSIIAGAATGQIVRRSPLRDYLIPTDCVLTVYDT